MYGEMARKYARDIARLLYPGGVRAAGIRPGSGSSDPDAAVVDADTFQAAVKQALIDLATETYAEREGITLEEARERVGRPRPQIEEDSADSEK